MVCNKTKKEEDNKNHHNFFGHQIKELILRSNFVQDTVFLKFHIQARNASFLVSFHSGPLCIDFSTLDSVQSGFHGISTKINLIVKNICNFKECMIL